MPSRWGRRGRGSSSKGFGCAAKRPVPRLRACIATRAWRARRRYSQSAQPRWVPGFQVTADGIPSCGAPNAAAAFALRILCGDIAVNPTQLALAFGLGKLFVDGGVGFGVDVTRNHGQGLSALLLQMLFHEVRDLACFALAHGLGPSHSAGHATSNVRPAAGKRKSEAHGLSPKSSLAARCIVNTWMG